MSEKTKELVKEFTVLNKYGIHARPAALFVKTASRFQSEIWVERGSSRVSGKSIMGLMTIEASYGTRLKVYCSGPDAEEAMNAIGKLFEEKFMEE